MLIYNVTVSVQNEIKEDWLQWMQAVHIPEVMATGCFESNSICQVVFPEPEDNATTYAIQYKCKHPTILQNYVDNFAPALKQSVVERYNDKFVAFRTVLKEINPV